MLAKLLETAAIRARATIPLEWREAIFGRSRGFDEKEDRHSGDSFQSKPIYYRQGEDREVAHESWFRGEQCNFLASKVNLAEPDAIDKYILKGWLPDAPFITRDDFITAFGSCFARHITHYLKERGYQVGGNDKVKSSYVIRCGEGMVNTFVILQQFQWAYENKEFNSELWYGSKGEVAQYLDAVRDETRAIFEQSTVFVITLGLSEIWFDKLSGDVMWRAPPRAKYDPERHGTRFSTVSENQQNIAEIIRIIRMRRPNASIIFTLSPIPLVATFRPVSCITANSVSKAVLRVAIDEIMRANVADRKLFYFPSYEIIKEFFVDPFEKDNRHPRPAYINAVMESFAKHYLADR